MREISKKQASPSRMLDAYGVRASHYTECICCLVGEFSLLCVVRNTSHTGFIVEPVASRERAEAGQRGHHDWIKHGKRSEGRM